MSRFLRRVLPELFLACAVILRQFGVEVYRTDQQGDIAARTDGQGIRWEFK